LHLFALAKRRITDAMGRIYGQYEVSMGGPAQEILLFSMLAVAIVQFQNQSALALTLLLAIAFVALALWHDRYDRWSFFIVALFGTCAECSSCTTAFGAMLIRPFLGSPCGSLWHFVRQR
jgi:cyanate permease